MRQTSAYRNNAGKLGLLFLLAVMIWCNAGFIAWNAARKISYEYVRSHRGHLKFRDTIILPAFELQGSADLVWMKHDEIRYYGQMFDIKKQVKQADGKVVLIGHYDKFENKLFKSLESLLKGHTGTPAKNKSTPLWFCEAIIPQYETALFIPCDQIKYFTTYNCATVARWPEVLSPPPDNIS